MILLIFMNAWVRRSMSATTWMCFTVVCSFPNEYTAIKQRLLRVESYVLKGRPVCIVVNVILNDWLYAIGKLKLTFNRITAVLTKIVCIAGQSSPAQVHRFVPLYSHSCVASVFSQHEGKQHDDRSQKLVGIHSNTNHLKHTHKTQLNSWIGISTNGGLETWSRSL